MRSTVQLEYINVLKAELSFTKNKLKTSSKESLPMIKLQITQIKRDILRNSKSEVK